MRRLALTAFTLALVPLSLRAAGDGSVELGVAEWDAMLRELHAAEKAPPPQLLWSPMERQVNGSLQKAQWCSVPGESTAPTARPATNPRRAPG